MNVAPAECEAWKWPRPSGWRQLSRGTSRSCPLQQQQQQQSNGQRQNNEILVHTPAKKKKTNQQPSVGLTHS